jgi:hypothetical protein
MKKLTFDDTKMEMVMAWLGLAWLGLAWLGLAWRCGVVALWRCSVVA